MIKILLVALAAFTLFFIVAWVVLSRRHPADEGTGRPSPLDAAIGFVANFLDTLGIGSFATTTAMFRFAKTVTDGDIPGTLNVGHTLPTICEAFIFLVLIAMDARTLIAMIVAAVIGAWVGAGIVTKLPQQKIRVGLGLCLIGAAVLMYTTKLHSLAPAGATLGLTGKHLIAGVVGNFVLGALMPLGIGLYAPCMILVGLLGMSPVAAFPVMMGSCAFLMPVGSARFVKAGRYNRKAALGLALGGIPGVLLAAFVVKSLPLKYLYWLVIVVVLYTAVTLLLAASRSAKENA